MQDHLITVCSEKVDTMVVSWQNQNITGCSDQFVKAYPTVEAHKFVSFPVPNIVPLHVLVRVYWWIPGDVHLESIIILGC